MEKKSPMMLIGILIGLLVIAGGAFALLNNDDDTDDDMDTSQNTEVVQERSDMFPIDITLTNLEPLSQGEYEGWVVRGDDKFSFGRFNTTESGGVDGEFTLDDVTPRDGDTIAISIEPENDPDPDPSPTIILAGEIQDNNATLAFPLDVSGFSGQYILATPTTTTVSDETAGIWFTTTGSDTTLDIPVAPEGWIYEGWVVVDGVPITSGQFTDPSKADMFDGYSGPGNAPDKPGEDFIQGLPNDIEGPLELATGDSMIVLSIEPYQNGADPTGPNPAQVKPLSHGILSGATDHTAYDLELSTASLPSGSARL